MTGASSTTAVAVLVRMADSAFDGQHWHATMRNVNSLNDEDWDRLPPGGERTIRELVRHIGKSKAVFASQQTGDRSYDWPDPIVNSAGKNPETPDELKAWLHETHEAFRDGIASLDDADLTTSPDGYFGGKEVQWSIEVLIQHEVYHAGEINHIRALLHANDGWGNEPSAEDLA